MPSRLRSIGLPLALAWVIFAADTLAQRASTTDTLVSPTKDPEPPPIDAKVVEEGDDADPSFGLVIEAGEPDPDPPHDPTIDGLVVVEDAFDPADDLLDPTLGEGLVILTPSAPVQGSAHIEAKRAMRWGTSTTGSGEVELRLAAGDLYWPSFEVRLDVAAGYKALVVICATGDEQGGEAETTITWSTPASGQKTTTFWPEGTGCTSVPFQGPALGEEPTSAQVSLAFSGFPTGDYASLVIHEVQIWTELDD